MYLRKIRPRTTCLYSAASIEPRRASAASHILFSKPRVAPLLAVRSFLGVRLGVILDLYKYGAFSAERAYYSRLSPFYLVPSFEMINYSMMTSQVELKISEASSRKG